MWLFKKLPVSVRRRAYRLAYAVLRVYWLTLRPRTQGVKCVLTHGDDVLLVRHTYGPRGWDLPGGSMRRREAPERAAQRETREELGITIDDWRALGALRFRADGRRDTLHCFHAELPSREIHTDTGELAHTQWFPRGRLPAPLNRYVRMIVGLRR